MLTGVSGKHWYSTRLRKTIAVLTFCVATMVMCAWCYFSTREYGLAQDIPFSENWVNVFASGIIAGLNTLLFLLTLADNRSVLITANHHGLVLRYLFPLLKNKVYKELPVTWTQIDRLEVEIDETGRAQGLIIFLFKWGHVLLHGDDSLEALVDTIRQNVTCEVRVHHGANAHHGPDLKALTLIFFNLLFVLATIGFLLR